MKDEEKYEFNLSDPDSWSKMPRPYTSPEFIEETNRIGGMNKHGQPRFKWVWGMSEEVYIEGDQFIESGWYLKYQLCDTGRKLTGFAWNDITGKRHFVERLENVPKDVLNAVPQYRVEQIGTPRWALEEWREAGDCGGMYDRAGYYFSRWIVQEDQPENPATFLKPYRDPNQKDLEILAHYIQLTANLTEDEVKEGVKAEREAEEVAQKAAKAEAHEQLTDTIVEIIHDLKDIDSPKPSKEEVKAAWQKLENRHALRTEH